MCWTQSREEQLNQFAQAKGKEVTDFYLQLDFILSEIDNSYLFSTNYSIQDWIEAKTPEESALAFTHLYLHSVTHENLTATLAQEIYTKVR